MCLFFQYVSIRKLQRKSSRMKFTVFSKRKEELWSAQLAPPTKNLQNDLGVSRDRLTSLQERSDRREQHLSVQNV